MRSRILINLSLITFVISLNLSLVLANPFLDLQINKENFVNGDELLVSGLVYNDLDQQLFLQVLIANFQKDGSAVSKTLEIAPNSEERIEIYRANINENFQNGNYSVLARLTDESQNIFYYSDFMKFTVSGQDKDILLDIEFDKKILVLRDELEIAYSTNVEGVVVSSTLYYPDGTENEISLPTTFSPNQIGTYEIKTVVSKEGYKTITRLDKFGVIQESPEFESLEFSGNFPTSNKNWFYPFFILFLILVVFVIFIIVLFIIRKKKEESIITLFF